MLTTDSLRNHCENILSIIPIFEKGLRAPLEGISEELLNHVFAPHKMTIGQIAIHCTAWMTYFLTEPKPWNVVEWTCKYVEYPLSAKTVHNIIVEGFSTMINLLQNINDQVLEVREGKKGPGYIILRLLHHVLAHSNQMSYLRQLHDKDWSFGNHFGDMATALIQLPYSTSRDFDIRGF